MKRLKQTTSIDGILHGHRKVMPMGHGGLVVCVPLQWAHKHNVRVGDMLDFAASNILSYYPKTGREREEPKS